MLPSFGFAFGPTGGLDDLEAGHVLLQVAVDALLLRFRREDFRGCQSGVDFSVFGFDFVRFGVVAAGEEVVFYGTDPPTRNAFLASTSRG